MGTGGDLNSSIKWDQLFGKTIQNNKNINFLILDNPIFYYISFNFKLLY